ncbi:MAG: helix-turn-helix transcriptional regulator [bacterium]|nr:helix-turn-helix transcriptional regulator [bacterium]
MKITLRALRVNAGFTIKEASYRLGISSVTLRSYENKKTKPNIDLLNRMLKLYNVKFSNFEYSNEDQELILT